MKLSKRFGSFIFLYYICTVKLKKENMDYNDLKNGDVIGYPNDNKPVNYVEKPKMVSLDRIVEYLNGELYTSCDYFGNVQTASRDSINKKEFIEKLCKAMEE